MSILSIYAAYRLTRIVEWSVGKKPRRDSFERFTAVDDDVLVFIARNLAKRKRLRGVAVALLHATNMKQREIAEILSLSVPTVCRALKSFLVSFYQVSGGPRVFDVEDK